MKYTEDNVMGLEFNLGSSHYKVLNGNKGPGLYSITKGCEEYMGYGLEAVVKNFNNKRWTPKNSFVKTYETYEIY